MLAYKSLDKGRSPFTGYRWQVPASAGPGPWIESTGPLGLCVNGIHACTIEHLPLWIGVELWTVELAGEIIETPVSLVAPRARLVEKVTGWDKGARVAYAQDASSRAAARVGPQGSPLVDFIAKMSSRGVVGEAGYWSAVLAGEMAAGRRNGADYDRAFAAERALQAGCLAEILGRAPGVTRAPGDGIGGI